MQTEQEWNEERVSRENTILNWLRVVGPRRADEIFVQMEKYMDGAQMQATLDELVRQEKLSYFKGLGTYGVSGPVKRLSSVNLEPMPGKVIVRLDTSDQQIGGLWLVRTTKQSIGQIVAIYDDFDDPDTGAHVQPFLRLEDWVIFGVHSGVEVTFNRDKFIILRESEILCRVIDPEAVEDKKGVHAI